MTKFIKLHRAANNAVIIVNIDQIVGAMNDVQNGQKVTEMWLKTPMGKHTGLLINESAEKVYAALEILTNPNK